MTRYRSLLEGTDEAIEQDFDDRNAAIEWAMNRLSPDHPQVSLFHPDQQGGWERIGIYDHEHGSSESVQELS